MDLYMSDLPALLERYRRGAELLAMVLTGVFGEEEDFAIAPGKWSVRQIVAHLADAELVGAHRFRQVIAEDNPTIIAYDQDAWTRNLDYARRKPTPAPARGSPPAASPSSRSRPSAASAPKTTIC